MAPIPIAPLIVAGLQAGYGIYQNIQGSKAAKEAERNKPIYEIPKEVRQAMLSAQLKSRQGLSAEVKSEMLQQMDRSSASSLRQMNERRGGLGAISRIHQSEQDAMRQIGIMDVQQREQNLKNLQAMRMQMGTYRDKEFGIKQEDYIRQAQSAAAMKGAGIQNIAGGLMSATKSLMAGARVGDPTTDISTTETPVAGDSDSPAFNTENYSGLQYTPPTSPLGLSKEGGFGSPQPLVSGLTDNIQSIGNEFQNMPKIDTSTLVSNQEILQTQLGMGNISLNQAANNSLRGHRLLNTQTFNEEMFEANNLMGETYFPLYKR